MIKLLIYEYLLNSCHKRVYQTDIAKDLNCSKMHVSKVIKELIIKGIIVKDSKNSVAVINPFLLCAGLAFLSEKEKPLYFQAPDFKDVLAILRKAKFYCLTSESAKAIKKGKIPETIAARILSKDINLLRQYFNEVLRLKDANLVIYPSSIMKFMLTNNYNGIDVANDWQMLLDLMKGNKLRDLDKIF
ncbi:MAG: hypothetical protein PHT91_03875 [Candidatus Nanoarchaeia archaeon]|nr:hypothetical protein [Candidatus Nanoarchaeia archaeon]MDD5499983.1 hypothetical protein [Candidatus Nanoarchaeia archaeon]